MSQSMPPELKPRKERLEPGSLREQRQTLADTCGELLRGGRRRDPAARAQQPPCRRPRRPGAASRGREPPPNSRPAWRRPGGADPGRRGRGYTLSLRRLLLAEPETVIEDLVEPGPISVQVDVDQEEIVRIFAEYDLLAVPVVEKGGELVGQVTVDDIVDVIRDEATEDIYEMAAMSSEEIGEHSTFAVMRRRLPWLLLCLAGTLACGAVIDRFEDLLSRLGALILFVPAIMAMGGNSGIQTSTVTVRSLATENFPQRNLMHVVWRELRTALGMGLFLGLLVGGVAGMWAEAGVVAACVGIAMAAAIILSALLGAVVPLLFRTLGIDPAVSSGPLITTLNDVLSLAIYFAIAAAVLRIWN